MIFLNSSLLLDPIAVSRNISVNTMTECQIMSHNFAPLQFPRAKFPQKVDYPRLVMYTNKIEEVRIWTNW